MNKIVISHYNECDHIRTYFVTWQTQLATIPLFAPARIIFNNHMTEFEAYISKQSVNLRPLASEKKIYKKIMANCINKYIDRGFSQATMLELFTIATSLDFSITYVAQAADKLAVTRAKEFRNILNDNKGDLDEITEDIIDEIDEKIHNFNTVLTLPTAKIKDRKAEGTEKIPPVILKLKADRKVFKKMINSYLPELNASWKDAAKIGEPTGVRRLSMSIKVIDSIGIMPLKGVKTTAVSTTETLVNKTTKRGSARLYSLPNALWDITVEYPGYASQTILNVPTILDKVVRLVVKLVKIVPPPVVPNPPLPNT